MSAASRILARMDSKKNRPSKYGTTLRDTTADAVTTVVFDNRDGWRPATTADRHLPHATALWTGVSWQILTRIGR